ncbi:MAG: thioredoxin family protein [Chloroflexota bacterium]
MDGLEEQYGERVTIKRINAQVGDGPAIMQEYRLGGHPTLLIFDQNGAEVQRWLGPQPAQVVEELLQRLVTNS